MKFWDKVKNWFSEGDPVIDQFRQSIADDNIDEVQKLKTAPIVTPPFTAPRIESIKKPRKPRVKKPVTVTVKTPRKPRVKKTVTVTEKTPRKPRVKKS